MMTATLEREAWLAERRTGLGSSEAAPIAGLSPWTTALEVYLRHVGELPPQEMTQAMRMGLKLEPVIASLYEEETGRTLQAPPSIIRHPEREWMLASLDRVADDRIVELKTAGQWAKDQWGDGQEAVPEGYMLQVQHQMDVAGADLCDIAVLLAGQEFRVYSIERSDALISMLVEIEAEFWDRIQTRRPPEPQWEHPATPALVKALYGFSGESVMLGEDEQAAADEYLLIGEKIKELTGARDAARAKLLYAMKESATATLPSGLIVTRKQVTRKAYSVPESTYVDMRVKKAKAAKA